MIGFSGYLEEFMKINSISIAELAKETNIDRTTIYRYVKGTRVPSEVDVVFRIADALQMSVSERTDLLEEYDKLMLGESVVYSYRYLENLFRSMEKLSRQDVVEEKHWTSIREFKMSNNLIELNSKEKIATYILDLFRYLANSGVKEKIYIIMQPVYTEIQKIIPQIFAKSEIEMEQIICIEQNVSRNYKNLSVFQEILPCLFFVPGYEVYYYYESISNHINNMTTMPNIIFVQDYVIQFDYKMECGFAVKSEMFVQIMKEQYLLLKKEVENLVIKAKKITNDFCCLMEENDEKIGNYFRQFSMAFCLDKEILEEHLFPTKEKEVFIKNFLNMRGEWNDFVSADVEQLSCKLYSYGKYEGIDEFMRTGRIRELPEALYSPLTPEKRKLVLERMIYLIKEKRICYRLLSDEVLLPDDMQIYWRKSKKEIIINYIQATDILQIALREQSIYRTFQMNMEYLEKKGMICSEEETLDRLLKLQKKWRG